MSRADEWNTCNDPRHLIRQLGHLMTYERASVLLIGHAWLYRSLLTEDERRILKDFNSAQFGERNEEVNSDFREHSFRGPNGKRLRDALISRIEPETPYAISHYTNRCAMLGFLDAIDHAARVVGPTPDDVHPAHPWHRRFQDAFTSSLAPVADLVRCVFSNPYRPVDFDPRWRTETAIGIAGQMFDTREFIAMPILADALQDAGCEDTNVLSHCRSDGPHVRGCWVVDAVLDR